MQTTRATSSVIPYISADDITALLSPADAIRALHDELKAGLDPAADPPRGSFTTRHGEMLLMPAEAGNAVGVKIVNVAPANTQLALPRINGIYALFDAQTLQPHAIMDGAALTTLRTPAVSFAAITPALNERSDSVRVVIFGTGPQGVAHLATLVSLVGHRRIEQVTYVSRRALDLTSEATFTLPSQLVRTGTVSAQAELSRADIIICATGAAEPLFDSAAVSERAIVIAVGSHEPDRRELDTALIARSQVIVEDVPTALREAGDITMAVAERALDPQRLIPMQEFVTGRRAPAQDRPIVFKSTGMSWEDLALAKQIFAAWKRCA